MAVLWEAGGEESCTLRCQERKLERDTAVLASQSFTLWGFRVHSAKTFNSTLRTCRKQYSSYCPNESSPKENKVGIPSKPSGICYWPVGEEVIIDYAKFLTYPFEIPDVRYLCYLNKEEAWNYEKFHFWFTQYIEVIIKDNPTMQTEEAGPSGKLSPSSDFKMVQSSAYTITESSTRKLYGKRKPLSPDRRTSFQISPIFIFISITDSEVPHDFI